MVRGRPWVWVKLAASLTAILPCLTVSQMDYRCRARVDTTGAPAAVSCYRAGVPPIRDPLNVRDVDTVRQPVRAIVDTRFEVAESARIFDGGRVWVFTCRDDAAKASRLAQKNAEVVVLPSSGNGVDLHAMMEWMAARDINEVHVEAGSRLSGGLLDAGLADELLVYMAPALLGHGIAMAGIQPLESLARAQRFEFIETAPVGNDVRLRLRDPRHWQTLCQAAGLPASAS